jgi:peptidoglycan/LPS O-acetylase OafA/YrhL
LDGWRALSISMVLADHSRRLPEYPAHDGGLGKWVYDGNLGVRCFFLISGLLITWLMLQEHERRGQVDLGHFYIRRAFRILPVYLAFVLVLFMLQFFTSLTMTASMWATTLTFTSNYHWNSFTAGHLWSLSVEEQFYLIWPSLFVFCALATNARRTVCFLAIPVVVSPIVRVVASAYISSGRSFPWFLDPLLRQFSLFNCFDSLAIGCAAAFLLHHRWKWIEDNLAIQPWLPFLAGVVLVVTPHFLWRLARFSFFTVPFRNTSQAIGLMILVVQSVTSPKWGPYPILNWKPVVWVGVLSYSLYIWQQIFCTTPSEYGLPSVWWLSFPEWLLPVLAVAALSYYGLEKPFLRLRRRFRQA